MRAVIYDRLGNDNKGKSIDTGAGTKGKSIGTGTDFFSPLIILVLIYWYWYWSSIQVLTLYWY
jgi:hypothetical protein